MRYRENTIWLWNARKRCCKKVDSQGEHFTGIHDRFLRDPVYRESRLVIGWSERKCKEWDEVANEDHTYHLSQKVGEMAGEARSQPGVSKGSVTDPMMGTPSRVGARRTLSVARHFPRESDPRPYWHQSPDRAMMRRTFSCLGWRPGAPTVGSWAGGSGGVDGPKWSSRFSPRTSSSAFCGEDHWNSFFIGDRQVPTLQTVSRGGA